jgi:POT family proton-dependent oligopeptide transporter
MTSTTGEAPLTAALPQRTFFGEPLPIAYLAFTEAWERFSYYGMTSILVLYMSQQLFTPGHIEHIVGFAAFRAGLQSVFGPMSTVALASEIYGLYAGFMYFTPMLGGIVADRWIGRKAAVLIGAILMSLGHLAMAFDQSFLLAAALLIIGCGLLKGNISAQVGGLYPDHDSEGRTRGFAIFSIGINVGAVVGPLACGFLASVYGWHVGFALAGTLMLIGLVTYLIGYRHLPAAARRASAKDQAQPMDTGQWRIVLALIGVMGLTIFQSVIYYQNSNIALVWIDKAVDLNLLGFHVPTAWFNSIDPLISILSVPGLFALWRWQAKRGQEPADIGKIAVGAWISAVANLVLVIGCAISPRVSVIFPIVYDVLLGVGFLYYWPTLLALVSQAAPTRVNSTLMGVVFLSLFISYNLIGWIGGFYEQLGPIGFWGLNVAIGAVGALLCMALQKPLERVLGLDQARATA